MAYFITDTCIGCSVCELKCPVDTISGKSKELYVIHPEGCIDCGACVPACTSDSIHVLEDVPEDKKEFIEKNAAYFKQ